MAYGTNQKGYIGLVDKLLIEIRNFHIYKGIQPS